MFTHSDIQVQLRFNIMVSVSKQITCWNHGIALTLEGSSAVKWCRDACQISKWSDKCIPVNHSFDILRDLQIHLLNYNRPILHIVYHTRCIASMWIQFSVRSPCTQLYGRHHAPMRLDTHEALSVVGRNQYGTMWSVCNAADDAAFFRSFFFWLHVSLCNVNDLSIIKVRQPWNRDILCYSYPTMLTHTRFHVSLFWDAIQEWSSTMNTPNIKAWPQDFVIYNLCVITTMIGRFGSVHFVSKPYPLCHIPTLKQ